MLNEWKKEKKKGQRAKATVTYSFLNRDFVIVSDWVLPKEVKLYHVFLTIQLWVQIDMLHTKWAATHSVRCFSFLLLIACSQSKLSRERWKNDSKWNNLNLIGSKKPEPEVSQLSLETEHQSARLGNSGLYTVASSSIKWSMENHSDIILSQKTKLLPPLFSQMGMEERQNFFFFLNKAKNRRSIPILGNQTQ